jgi:hypothetical protein
VQAESEYTAYETVPSRCWTLVPSSIATSVTDVPTVTGLAGERVVLRPVTMTAPAGASVTKPTAPPTAIVPSNNDARIAVESRRRRRAQPLVRSSAKSPTLTAPLARFVTRARGPSARRSVVDLRSK